MPTTTTISTSTESTSKTSGLIPELEINDDDSYEGDENNIDNYYDNNDNNDISNNNDNNEIKIDDNKDSVIDVKPENTSSKDHEYYNETQVLYDPEYDDIAAIDNHIDDNNIIEVIDTNDDQDLNETLHTVENTTLPEPPVDRTDAIAPPNNIIAQPTPITITLNLNLTSGESLLLDCELNEVNANIKWIKRNDDSNDAHVNYTDISANDKTTINILITNISTENQGKYLCVQEDGHIVKEVNVIVTGISGDFFNFLF